MNPVSAGLLAAWLGHSRGEVQFLVRWQTRGLRSALQRSRAMAVEFEAQGICVSFGWHLLRPSRVVTAEWREELAAAFGVGVDDVEVRP